MITNTLLPLSNGILTGMILQLALGPVFFFIMGVAMETDTAAAFSAVIAVTLADYIYIFLSLLGLGQILKKEKPRAWFSLISSAVLVVFGMMILARGIGGTGTEAPGALTAWTPLKAFTAGFFMTISSPLTIVFWSGIFSAKALEKGYRTGQLIWFGLGTGSSTLLFLSASIFALSTVKTQIPAGMITGLNCLVGLILTGYGVKRGIVSIRDRRTAAHPGAS